MARPIRPRMSKEEMTRLYHEEELSWAEVAERIGCTAHSARKWARFYGIPFRPLGTWTARSRAKESAAKKGVKRGPLSEEWRRRIGEASKGHVVSQEHFKGRVFSEETRRRMSESHKGAIQTPEMNQRRSETMKRLWQAPGAREKWAGTCTGRNGRDSFTFGVTPPLSASKWNLTVLLPDGVEATFRSEAEATVAHALTAAGIRWEYEQHRFELKSGEATYCPDFYLPELDRFVEVGCNDGETKAAKRRQFYADYPELSVVEWGHTAAACLRRGVATVAGLLEDPRMGVAKRTAIAPPITLQVIRRGRD
jgi:hypothetical protein